MRLNSIRGGQGTRSGAPTARERGWDDSLYEDGRVPRARRGHGQGSGANGGSGDGSGDGGGGARPRRKRRVLRWFILCLSLLILATAGAGYFYYAHLNGNLSKDLLNLGDNKLDKSNPNAAGQTPLNILLLGSDSRNSKKNVQLGGSRADRDRPPLADVQMLLHVSADRSNMSVLSIPRDTKATIPKCTDPDDGKVHPKTTAKINTSLQHGGPGCTVAAWEELTGIPVDHFMMIDFSGVVSMADAVGGVPVCVDDNVADPQSKLRLKKGESVVRGEQALHWLRTRHGFGDGTDIGRARAQHMYMNSMVRQLKAGTKLSDPGKMRDLAEAATKALTVDEGLGTVKKLYDLGNDLKRVPTKRITMATMPWKYAPGGYVVPKEGDADHTFSLIRNDVSLDGRDKKKAGAEKSPEPTEPSTPKSRLPVRVMNGTGTALQAPVTGRAGAIVEHLGQEGFDQATADQGPKSQADTTVSYPRAAQRGDALAVAKALGLPDRAVKHSNGVQEVTLVIGADWREGTAYPKGEDGGSDGEEKKNKAPDSADALRGDDKAACMEVNPSYVW
ncbi:MAG: LCP family protein [Streptomyces sp.]|uniref:LCP family protein n=1 Tax=Streptomyces sp. TaxID=1931 RepID=UPI003D6B5050